jgi:antirestriction protein ArdC
MLWSAAVARGFAAPIWITFKQARAMGAHVRKGEKGNLVVYASRVTCIETDEETGEKQERDIPFMRGYTDFNVEQIDGLPEQFYTSFGSVVTMVQLVTSRPLLLSQRPAKAKSCRSVPASTWPRSNARSPI